MEEPLVGIGELRPSSLRPAGPTMKSSLSGSGRYTRRLHSTRSGKRDLKGGWLPWLRSNRVVFWLLLITIWAYIGFHVQSTWVSDHKESEFIKHRNVEKLEDITGVMDASAESNGGHADGNKAPGKGSPESKLKKTIKGLVRKGRRVASRISRSGKKTKRRSAMEKVQGQADIGPPKIAMTINKTTYLDDGISKRNTSYGLKVGPFGSIEDSVLGWSPDKRRGTCDRKSEFAKHVWSRRFVLVFHDLSMTGPPLSMMELATELLSCGAYLSVIALNMKGGLMGELNKRGIKVMPKGELSFKAAKKSDLIVAGSTHSTPWIAQYYDNFTPGSTQVLWWIMENQREQFDRAKNNLPDVKMLMFLSEMQSKQWLTWCEEEKIQLKMKPTVVPLSVNDELAFVVGIPSSLNTPLFSVDHMLEKRHALRVSVRKEMGLSDDDVVVTSLSSIGPEKGQLLLLESALLMSERKLPPINIKIGNYTVNITGDAGQDGQREHTAILSEENLAQKLKDSLLNTNATGGTGVTVKKRKRSSRRKAGRTRTSRKLLAVKAAKKKRVLKILIGSVGSKSNTVSYIKEMLKFLSLHPDLSKSLLWTPSTTRISSLYAASDVFVINSQGLGETFGRVTIEAMAFGLPVLGTDAGGTKEIIEDKVTGLLHPTTQEGIKPLAQNLQFLLNNPSARAQLGKNGRLKVEKMYLKRHMYKNLAKVFIQCMRLK